MRTRNAILLLFFVAGAAFFALLVARVGIDQIADNVRNAGWTLAITVSIWGIIYALNALVWKLLLGRTGDAIPYPHLFLITVSGFVLNDVTPLLSMGGEPYKMKILADILPPQRAISAVVLYRIIHLMAHMLILLTGIAVLLAFLALPMSVAGALAVSAVFMLAIAMVLFSGQRGGVFQRLVRLAGRIPFLGGLARRLARHEDAIRDMDALITDAYHGDRKRFFLALGLEYSTRLLMAIEIYAILAGFGMETTLLDALFLYVVYSIVINVFFFVPMNVGAREGGFYFGMESLSLTPAVGVAIAIMMRLREFCWILIGLLFIPITARVVLKIRSGCVH